MPIYDQRYQRTFGPFPQKLLAAVPATKLHGTRRMEKSSNNVTGDFNENVNTRVEKNTSKSIEEKNIEWKSAL